MRWTVVIPVKALPAAKSRLVRASAGPEAHRRLVEAIRTDTAAAARAADGVARVLFVSDAPGVLDPAPGEPPVLVQTEPGLNGALRDAATHAQAQWPIDGVAALVGDLPSLLPEHLGAALAQASAHPRAFVADAQGTGTTLLTAGPGTRLVPSFGAGSAARHAAHAHAVVAGPTLRADVDTPADLAAARLLGVRHHTAAALDPPSDDGAHDNDGRGTESWSHEQ